MTGRGWSERAAKEGEKIYLTCGMPDEVGLRNIKKKKERKREKRLQSQQ